MSAASLFGIVFDAIREWMKRTEPAPAPKKPAGEIGFHTLLPAKGAKDRATLRLP